ncbi:hypothetical protein JAF85_003160 [Citrobacter werkmanii]|nr:hypothetical protein [Citrobacter werkmanii]EGT0672392.1 hypothetical protein [Citrobacter werkmanii]
MTWNFHQYYTNRSDGLVGKLLLSEQEKEKLKSLRQMVRIRIRDVFEEAKSIAKDVKKCALTVESTKLKLGNTRLKYLSDDDQKEVAKLIYEMDDETLDEFINLRPRFWTQGSFQYDTLNRPFHYGQEMDIDDGTYLPMPIFENEPKIGHTLLLLLVDSSLKSLEAENAGWVFEKKRTCGRIKIPKEKTHIDIPMYAIPKEQFLKKEEAISEAVNMRKSMFTMDSADSEDYKVDSEYVNLALREGLPKWFNSDPKIVEDWFNDSCKRIGRHLRKICRFMKAWRDAQWDVGGPSSICLMTATVNILDRLPHDKDDLGKTMRLVAENLPDEFSRGVESPDDTDEKLLFPSISEHGVWENAVMDRLRKLPEILINAENADTKQSALDIINTAYGNRVTNSDLIILSQTAQVLAAPISKASSPVKISSTMVSG